MKKVLIISYHFPPDPSIGGLRMQGLAKYLPEFGWEPIILTKRLSDVPDIPNKIIQTPYIEHDALVSLKRKIGFNPDKSVKDNLEIASHKNERTFIDSIINFIFEIISYPDLNKDWLEYAVKSGNDLLRNEKIDAIISSSAPVTSHTVARNLKLNYNIPWIADLRDLWTQNPYYPYSHIRKVVEKRLEIKTLASADSLVTTTRESGDILSELHSTKHVYSIPNGFDPEHVNYSTEDLTSKFTITYTGNLYNGKRDPSSFFQALHELITEGKINPQNVEVRFYGPKESWMIQEIENYKLQGVVYSFESMPRKSILKIQRESQLLLLLIWNDPKERSVCPGKIYEYMAARRPIFAVGGSEGVVSELLNETLAGVYTSSVRDIKKILEDYYREYEQNGYVSYRCKQENVDKYSQKEMARKFSSILNNL